MGTHTVEMSEKEREGILATAREVAAELHRNGAEYDAKNSFPYDIIPIFKETGLVALPVSKEYGGLGGDILTVSQVVTELAKGDPPCALALNMHYVLAGMLAQVMDEPARQVWLPKVAVERKVMCGPFSEGRAGISGLADTAAIPKPDGGWSVTGKKNWGTLSQGADIVIFNATITDSHGNLPTDPMERFVKERVFIVDVDTPGISIKETWDAMGMRATGTQTVIFEDVAVPADANLGDFRQTLLAHFEWAVMGFAGVYYGLALKAYGEALQVARTKQLGATQFGPDVSLKDVGHVQSGLGQMQVINETTQRVIDATGRRLLDGRDAEWDPMARVPMIEVAKIVATENALRIVDTAMRIVGGSSYRRGHTLERLYRDARSGLFHPLTTEQTHEVLGKHSLGLLPG